MSRVELDVYSGLPNPQWKLTPREERELIDRLMVVGSVMRPVEEVEARLGYRGMIVTADQEDLERFAKLGLPPQFRLRETPDLDVSDVTERWLLRTAGAEATTTPEAQDEARGTIGSPPAQSSSGSTVQSASLIAACTIWWTSWPELNTFWNGSDYTKRNNNCYNFASSLATNTFAQPGRGSGQTFTALTISNIKSATFRDGYTSTCSGDRFEDYLCIWPGNDYHFYHRIPDASGTRRWAHKPGSTSARNTDNSGRIITNPVTCDRGPYTTSGAPNIFAPVNPRARIR